jgi:hypothetical protein
MVVYNTRGLIYQNGDDVNDLEYFRIQLTGMGFGFGVLMGTRECIPWGPGVHLANRTITTR